ncbi:MAG: hypothetical protein AUK03_03420 [Anaerolineae bacterium CG2_30_64_16]|nr:MAG: hypothetical protein AUK03_03420 [Anaerolineae bacterium CG2_30_64_16]
MYVWVRSAAVQALGQLGWADDATLAGLLALARDAQVYARIRYAAAEALGQLDRADDATTILLALARDAQVYIPVRSGAYVGLKRLLAK